MLMKSRARFQRVVLKLSGEALKGERPYGIDPPALRRLAGELKDAAKEGVQIGLVVGGGNIFRGVMDDAKTMTRSSADQIGMLATLINALAIQDALEAVGQGARVMTAIPIGAGVAEPFDRRRAIEHLEQGRIVLFACGTGNPYFSTDTAGALRACEIGAQALLKGTKVDGVYTADPFKDPKAKFLKEATYQECLTRNLRVMDATAIALCRENRLPIAVFNLFHKGNIRRVVRGERVGTLIRGESDGSGN